MKFLIVILFLPFFLFSQSRKMVLHIDTLITDGSDFVICVADEPSSIAFPSDIEIFAKDSILINKNYSFEIKDSLFLMVIMDSKYGYLSLKNVYRQQSDTIRISKHEIFSNCVADTIKTRVYWIDENVPEDLKQKARERDVVQPLNCDTSPPKTLHYKINDQEFEVLTVIISEGSGFFRSILGETKPRRFSFSKSKRQSYRFKKYKVNFSSILTAEIVL